MQESNYDHVLVKSNYDPVIIITNINYDHLVLSNFSFPFVLFEFDYVQSDGDGNLMDLIRTFSEHEL